MDPSASAPALELRSASAAYKGEAVLTDISVSIRAGERVALVGQSGAGKSTLLHLLYSRQPEGAALVPQDFGLVRTLSVFHNVYMGRLHRHSTWYNLLNLARPFKREVEQVRAVLQKLNLEEKLFAPIGELSGGQQQRAALARVLHQRGRVLLADEPCSALDEPQAHVVLAAINATYDTVVLAMHDVRLALQYTDRVIGIKDKRVAFDAPTRDLEVCDLSALYA